MKKEKKIYDSILAFELPLTIGETIIKGFVYKSNEVNANNTKPTEESRKYVEYLVGCKKWLDNGNEINQEKCWVDKNKGLFYEDKCDFIKDFCKQAYEEEPILYSFIENTTLNYSVFSKKGCYINNDRYGDWIVGQIVEQKDYKKSYYEDWRNSDIIEYDYYWNSKEWYRELQIIKEEEFKDTFIKEMNKYGFPICNCGITFWFKYKNVDISIEPSCHYYWYESEWEEWDTDSKGNWFFILSPKYSEDCNLFEILDYNFINGDIESFVKEIIKYVKNANFWDHSKEREAEQLKAEDSDLPF